ncbi:Dolichol kinase [Sarcoptes scabiei]|uniref:dolichol kinase n=1 Tax=Sarcoptes scabiei TaxID=52283 RepID=A0A834R5J1_SARSC|nr:Dolichol kinase [Sarcoptes scabiei]
MFSRTKLQFRNDIDGLHYCLMLPLIGWITERSSSYQEANANQWLMSYVFLNATIVLLEFRFNCNAFQKIVHQILFFLVIASQWYHFNWFRSILSLSSVLISNFLLSRILRSIPVKYFKSFTFAEFSIVFQSFIYFLFKVIQFEIYSSINVANISRSEIDLIINDTFSILLISSIISTFLCHSNTFKPFIFLIGIPTCVYTWLSLRLKTHLIRWLWNYLNETEPRIIRLSQSSVIDSTLDRIFKHYRDEKDSGLLTLTHIYLLVGCSLPIWLSSDLKRTSPLLLAIGILTIGVGDTVASVIGSTFGKIRWPNSDKTLIGTLGFFVSQLITIPFLEYYFDVDNQNKISINHTELIIVLSFLNSMIETFTNQIDNLVIPMIAFLLLKCSLWIYK